MPVTRNSATSLMLRAHVGAPACGRALPHDGRDLVATCACRCRQRRRHRAALAIFAMARRAVGVVERRVVVGDQLDDPRHLVRVDVEQSGIRIERRATPFRAAVEPGEHDRALERWRREKAGLELPEPLEHGRVRLGRASRQHRLGEALPRKRRRPGRSRLRRPRSAHHQPAIAALRGIRSGRATCRSGGPARRHRQISWSARRRRPIGHSAGPSRGSAGRESPSPTGRA